MKGVPSYFRAQQLSHVFKAMRKKTGKEIEMKELISIALLMIGICLFSISPPGFAEASIENRKHKDVNEISVCFSSKSKNDKEMEGLIAALSTAEWERAIDRLAKIGEAAVGPLIDALGDYSGHRYKPYRAALALGRIGLFQAEEALIKALGEKKTQDYVYRGIFLGLAEIRSHRAELAVIRKWTNSSAGLPLMH